jgi:hypothetical protein
MKPTLDALDERAVPSPLAGLGGLRAVVAVQRAARFGLNAGRAGVFSPAVRGFRPLLLARPQAAGVYQVTSPGDFPFGPGGYFNVVQTPGGPAGLRVTPAPEPTTAIAQETTTAVGDVTTNTSPPDATSPGDFPFGPGGYYNIVDTSDGPAGTRGGLLAPRPGQFVPDAPPNGTLNA